MIKHCFMAVICFGLFMGVQSVSVHADDMLDVQKVQSDQGVTAWLVEDHSVPIVSVSFAFRNAGSHNDTKDKQGLARMVSNTMDEGADDLDALVFQKTLTDNSISLSYSAGRDHFSGSLKTLTKHQDTAFNLLKKSLTKPRFDEAPFERMRQSNLSRIRASLSDPDWIAARVTNDVAYGNHSYALNSGGTLSTLPNIMPDDAREFHKRYINRENLVVAVAGDITPEALKTVLDNVFGALPQGEKAAQPARLTQNNQSKVFVYPKEIPQTSITITAPGVAKTDPDYYTAVVMNYVYGGAGFGSRLMETLREENGLTYGVYSRLYHMNAFNGLQITMATQNDTVKQALDFIAQETQSFADTPIDDTVLRDAKNYLNGSVLLSLTSTGAIASTMLRFQLQGLPADYLSRRATGIESVTADGVQSLAEKILQVNAFTTVLVGMPDNAGEQAVTIDALPNVE